VARLLKTWVADPSPCAYLPDRLASLEYRLMVDVTADELDGLLERGWRRFGPAYFRPGCVGCRECVPIRVPVDRFRRSRQQRRAWNRTAHLTLRVGPPRIDDARIELYDRWHADRALVRGWTHDRIDPAQYYHQFAFPHPSIREFAYYDDERLVGVAIVDQTPRALSAVYTFYDPALSRLSLGTVSILRQIEEARQTGREFVYLGYRVEGCPSSAYKGLFRPHQLMKRWVELDEPSEWAEAADAL
jgi:arginine-tRNA-protein transferase